MSGCTCRNAVPIVEHLPLLQVLRNSQQGLLLQSAGESCVFAYYVCLGVFQLSDQMKILTNIAVKVEKKQLPTLFAPNANNEGSSNRRFHVS